MKDYDHPSQLNQAGIAGASQVDNRDYEKIMTTAQEMQKMRDMAAPREQSVAEYLDKKIWDYESRIRAVRQFRETTSIAVLSSPAAYITAIFKD